uniref:PHD finger protein 21B n=1 Tax=Athene cunicularia TaxID=194338 RepID=A0A663M7N3_ATHCN
MHHLTKAGFEVSLWRVPPFFRSLENKPAPARLCLLCVPKNLHNKEPSIQLFFFQQTLGTITAVPIKVPQVSSLQRLAGQGPAVLPQVRPKTLIPDSLPISPCRDQPSKQPPTFQKATVVSIKNPSPALPTANNTVSHVQTPNSQSQGVTESTAISSPLSSAGVAYAIISTSPNNATPISTSATVSVVNDSIKVQPLLISADSKVIIIQPQVQTQTESKVETKKPPEELIYLLTSTMIVVVENLTAFTFLSMVTEIQSKRQERKRRSTANPAYSGLLETEVLYHSLFSISRQ